jgi:glycosyltransferase involved in cell wall biosynthesis
MPKVTYIISKINKALAFEWIEESFRGTDIELSFILLNNSETELERYLITQNIPVKRIFFERKTDIPLATLNTYLTLRKWKPDAVHCHLFEASIIGLYAAKWAGIPKRIYTRHHFLYHWEENPKAVKYDIWCNQWATDIVTLTENMGKFLTEKEKAEPHKIHYIPHGFKFDIWQNISHDSIKELKTKYNPENQYPVIGVIARWVEEKGVQYIVPAFEQLLQDYPDAKLLLANAKGLFKPQIETLLQQIPKKNYQIIDFEPNIAGLYSIFDIYVHVPTGIDKEPFGQTYIEALFAKKPSVFTLSGIANSFIEHEKNALIVEYQNSEAVYSACKRFLQDIELAQKLAENGYNQVLELFSLDKMIQNLKNIYVQ